MPKKLKQRRMKQSPQVIAVGKFELVRHLSGALMLNRVNDGEGMGVNEARLEKCLAAFYRREF